MWETPCCSRECNDFHITYNHCFYLGLRVFLIKIKPSHGILAQLFLLQHYSHKKVKQSALELDDSWIIL